MLLQIEKSDLLKILDALQNAKNFFTFRDQMNAAIHLGQTARYSPITSVIESAHERLAAILGDPDAAG